MSFKNSSGEISVSFTVGTYEYAIPNLKTLEKIDRHNNRKYHTSYRKELDLNLSKHNILIKGTDNLVEDVKKYIKMNLVKQFIIIMKSNLMKEEKLVIIFKKFATTNKKILPQKLFYKLEM